MKSCKKRKGYIRANHKKYKGKEKMNKKLMKCKTLKITLLVLALVILFALPSAIAQSTTTGAVSANFTLAPEQPSYPAISGLTNSTPTYTSVTITWTTNQTNSNNRVKYSTYSNLSGSNWSSWDNGTNTVSIGLTGLLQNTEYYYQAWSHNHLSDNVSTSEPVGSPFENFTTLKVPHGQALADAINTNDTVGVSASYASDVVTVTADTAGEAGNSITTTETVANASFASGTLTGGGTSSSPWAEYQGYGLDLWTAIGGLIILVAIVIVLGLVITGVINTGSGGGDVESNIPVLIGVSVGIAALVIVITIIPFMGYSVENIMPLTQDAAASGTLTFTGDAVDGETVTISNGVQTDVYEFDFDDSIAGGNIKVSIS